MKYLSPEKLVTYRLSIHDNADHSRRPLKLSPHVYFFQKGSLSMLYHALAMKVVSGGVNLQRLYAQCIEKKGIYPGDTDGIDETMAEFLLDQSFLIDFNADSDELLPLLRQRELDYNRNPSTLRLVPGTACNLRCRYCSHAFDRDEFMTLEEGTNAIDLFFKCFDNTVPPSIIISGYEPLLNWEVMRHLLVFSRKRAEKARAGNLQIELHTNGTMIDEKKAEILRDLDISVQMALDGREKEHDLARKTLHGGATCTDVIRGYRILSHHGIMPSLRCRIGLHNFSSLMETVHFFVEALECREIELSFVKSSELALPSGISMERALKVFEFLRRYGVKEITIMKKLQAFVEGKPILYSCKNGPAQIVALPGSVRSGCDAVFQKRNLISSSESESPGQCVDEEKCRRCPALTLCGGICSCDGSSMSAAGNREACIHAQIVLNWILDDLAAQVLPHDHNGGFFFLACGGTFSNNIRDRRLD